MKEITIFKQEFESFVSFLYKNGYTTKGTEILNAQQENNWYTIAYQNNNLKKKLRVTFYTSDNEFVKNEITVSLNDSYPTSISIPAFLVFQETKARVMYKDMDKYKFRVNPGDLLNSIKFQLDNIQKILENEMKEIFTTSKWIDIPVQDLRDDY